MGGTPGTSRRCAQCRSRRKRCDLNDPCLQCAVSGLKCSGPNRDALFIHRTCHNILKDSDRTALKSAFLKRHNQNLYEGERQSNDTAIVDAVVSFEPTNLRAVDNMINVRANKDLYAAVLHDFMQQSSITSPSHEALYPRGIPVYSGIASSIQALLPLASSEMRSIDLGIFSLLNLYIGKLRRHDQKQIHFSRTIYTQALHELRQRIEDGQLMDVHKKHDYYRQLVFCFCLALQLFEMVDQIGSPMSQYAHIDGILSILSLTGPTVLTTNHTRQAFSGFRGILTASAIRRRRETFLAEPLWLRIPLQNYQKTRVEQLYDLALQIPELLQRTDEVGLLDHLEFSSFEHEPVSHKQEQRAQDLLEDYIQLEADLVKCYHDTAPQRCDFRNDLSVAESVIVPETYLKARTGGRKSAGGGTYISSYDERTTSGFLLHYWTLSLELYMGLMDLHLTATRLGIDLRDQGYHILDLHRKASEIAGLIEGAATYLSQSTESQLVAKVPSETVSRYFAKIETMKIMGEYVTSPASGGTGDEAFMIRGRDGTIGTTDFALRTPMTEAGRSIDRQSWRPTESIDILWDERIICTL